MKGWYGNKYGHSLASRGIKSRFRFVSKGEHDIINKAIKHFGITDEPTEAGYILPDGRMLDFSDGKPFERIFDHDTISEIGVSLTDFMNLGAIRVNFPNVSQLNYGTIVYIEIIKLMTNAQRRTMSRAFRQEYKHVPNVRLIVDVGTTEYDEDTLDWMEFKDVYIPTAKIYEEINHRIEQSKYPRGEREPFEWYLSPYLYDDEIPEEHKAKREKVLNNG